MEWIIVLALISVGLILIVVAIIFVPGTTFIGITGLISTFIGVYFSFVYFGSSIGFGFLVFSALLFGVVLYFGFRGKTWDRFSLKSSIRSKVNEGLTSKLQIAQRGMTLSSLRPIGKAEFDGKTYEVKSHGDYIDTGTEVEIIKIERNNIFVEPIK